LYCAGIELTTSCVVDKSIPVYSVKMIVQHYLGFMAAESKVEVCLCKCY
jgi:hypothetical protein